MSGRLRKHTQRKYDLITKSAAKLFLKRGYTHTSMDAIAADAGVSKQTVYSYFTSKDLLFRQMVEDECARHSPSSSLLKNPLLASEEALRHIGHGYLRTILGKRGIAILRLVMTEPERHPHINQLFFESGPLKVQKILSHYLEEQIANGVFVIDDVNRASAYFFAMIKCRYRMRAALNLKPPPTVKELNDHVAHVVKMFFKMYGK